MTLVSEARAAIAFRPARAALTVAGTVLGIAALVSIVGLTTTAQHQVSSAFDLLAATTVTLQDAQPDAPDPFPQEGLARLRSVQGVRGVAVFGQVAGGDVPLTSRPVGLGHPADAEVTAPVVAVTAELFDVVHARLQSGRAINRFDETRRLHVAVVSEGIARTLHLGPVSEAPAVFVSGVGFTVVGILADVDRRPDLLLSVLVPSPTALEIWPGRASLEGLVETRPGAGAVVATQAAAALHPESPERFVAVPPPNLDSLRDRVSKSFATLLLALAGVSLVVGMIGIANTTLVAVLERVSEIGLRRALGARRWQVAAQFLLESAMLGITGGIAGSALGTVVVVAASAVQGWQAVLPPAVVFASPLLGLVTGVVAGLYPAVKASGLAPVEALRR